MTVIRPARVEEAPLCAELVNYAGEGMPLYLWEKMIAEDPSLGPDPWALGAARQMKKIEAGEIEVLELDGRPAAALTGYVIGPEPEPIDDDMPAMFRPLQELENLALSSWYVNVLATVPALRGKGCGAALLARAEQKARDAGLKRLSIIVADGNPGAIRLYTRTGYAETARRPMVKEAWASDSAEWVLMIKQLG